MGHPNWRRSSLILITVLLASCGGDSPTQTQTATQVTVSPKIAILDGIGATQQMGAAVTDQSGAAMNASVAWSADPTSVATVNSSGLVTAVAPGSVRITAVIGSIADHADLKVVQSPASATKVSGDAQTGVAGQTLAQPLVVQLLDKFGHPIAQGATGAFFAVTSGGGSVGTPQATTDANGRLTTTWTLGPTTGQQTVIMKYTPTGDAVLTFTATATAGTP